RVQHGPQHSAGVGAVRQAVQHGEVQQGDRLVEVDEGAQVLVGEDLLGFGHVGRDHRGGVVVGEEGAPVRQHDGVDVDVDDAGVRLELLGDLVHVVPGGHAAAHVDELAGPGVAGQVPHGPVEEEAVLPGDVEHFGRGPGQEERGLPV